MTFDAKTTTDEVLAGVDLSGSTAVITGAYGGLGLETARALASHGAGVVLAGRDPARLDAARDQLTALVTGSQIDTLTLDLASLDAVRNAAQAVAASHPRIDLLINNAGVMACPFSRTADGYEMQFGTNHLGHFLFTALLMDPLAASDAARVVCLSSAGHRESPILWDDPNFDRSPYSPWTAYGQSKTANALFAVELDRRAEDRGVRAFSVHPGVIMTELARHFTEEDFVRMAERAPAGGFEFKSVEAGAATTVWAATDAGLDDHGGAYLEDCGVAHVTDDPIAPVGVREWARDPEQARRLWDLSEKLVGQTTDW